MSIQQNTVMDDPEYQSPFLTYSMLFFEWLDQPNQLTKPIDILIADCPTNKKDSEVSICRPAKRQFTFHHKKAKSVKKCLRRKVIAELLRKL
jgi:hypothetical protein